MFEEMSIDELRSTYNLAVQLELICSGGGFPQAATIWLHTATAIKAELDKREST